MSDASQGAGIRHDQRIFQIQIHPPAHFDPPSEIPDIRSAIVTRN